MSPRRATGPVDVARLNASVFRAVLRKYEILLAVITPAYLVAAVLVVKHHLPAESAPHILALAIPMFLSGFVAHLLGGLVGVMFIVAIGSLVWWRHLLANGGPAAVIAALATAVRRLALRLGHCADTALPAALVRREHTPPAVPDHTVLVQLRAALVAAPDAPPSRLVHLADPMVRTDQLTPRRAA